MTVGKVVVVVVLFGGIGTTCGGLIDEERIRDGWLPLVLKKPLTSLC